jgi:HPt (histidine-containing phosphotransfer) domain-containing protein
MSLRTNQQEQFLVLIADNDIDCSLLELQLDQHCLSVVLTKEQNEISSLLNTSSFDLILLDFGFINLVKAADCINKQTPVIAIIDSASNNQNQKQNIIATGFDDYLIRPVTIIEIKEIIDLWHIKNKSTPAFDYIQAILNATQNNSHLTLTIFKKLFEEFPLQITAIKDALAHQQYPLAEEITHKLHGSACFCGLTAIQKSASSLENCLINKDYLAINPHFLILQQCIVNLINQQKTILELLKRI